MASPDSHRCARCRARLARDNPGPHCSACESAVVTDREQPPEVSASFWDHPLIRAAIRDRHMGRLIAAYRHHPDHGAPIAQGVVAGWAHLTQAQISRLEHQPTDRQPLNRLTFWARLLQVPPQLLWFTLPDSDGSAPSGEQEHPTGESMPWVYPTRLATGPDRIYVEAGPPTGHLTAEDNDNMRRRTIIQALAAVPLAGSAGSTRPVGDRIGSLEASAGALRRIYHDSSSPQHLLALVRSHLDATAEVLGQLPTGALKLRTLRNRSEIGTLAGRIAFFDLHRDHEARGFFGLAYEAAIQADDHPLATAALGHLAFVPAREGNLSASMDYLTWAARHATAGHLHSLGSWVAAVESELAARIEPTISLHALDRATELLAETSGEPAPPWFDYYSADRLAGFRGFVLLRLGRGDEARHVLTTALNGLEPAAIKQRTVFLADIAGSYLTGTDPDVDQACAVAGAGATALMQAGYATGTERLNGLRARLHPWDTHPAVQHLDERLASLSL